MGDLNDYKLINTKSIRHFNLAKEAIVRNQPEGVAFPSNLDDIKKARYGFYYFMLQLLTEFSDYDDITEIITDQEFNSTFFNNRDNDEGIDAIYIDEDKYEINLFNFKYRESFNEDREQSKNEAILSSKFLAAYKTGINDTNGKIKHFIDEIIKCNKSNHEWKTYFYIISNENKTLSPNDTNLQQLNSIYGVIIKTIGINEIMELSPLRPSKINARLVLPNEAVMSFQENSLSSNISYIVRMPLTTLIRLTCKDENSRLKHDLEEDDLLYNEDIDLNVLYDNVRGYIIRSKYNQNIEETLENNPSKFFYYNNGITIVADEINTTECNSKTKLKITINNLQVLNGGQTLRTIHKFNKNNPNNIINKLSKAEVLVRLLKVTDEELKSKIGENTNSQNSIDNMDLKSLRKEQLDIEHFFKEHEILYIRKKGDTGEDNKIYKDNISMLLLGQMLLSISGYPENISNKRKDIFTKYYDELFVRNENLISLSTIAMIQKYREIESSYTRQNGKISVQKKMYVLYLSYKLKRDDFNNLSIELENFVKKYMENHKTQKAESRLFITSEFKDAMDEQFSIQ